MDETQAHMASGLAGVTPQGPTVSVQQLGSSIQLFWPAEAQGFKLQENTDVANTESWKDVPGGTNGLVIQEIKGQARYHRLKKQ